MGYAILAGSWRLEGGRDARLQGAAEIADPRPVRRLHPAARGLDGGVEPHHADGAARRGRAGGAVGWLVVAFLVPEDARDPPHVLRSPLAWSGVGLVPSAVAIALRRLLPRIRSS